MRIRRSWSKLLVDASKGERDASWSCVLVNSWDREVCSYAVTVPVALADVVLRSNFKRTYFDMVRNPKPGNGRIKFKTDKSEKANRPQILPLLLRINKPLSSRL